MRYFSHNSGIYVTGQKRLSPTSNEVINWQSTLSKWYRKFSIFYKAENCEPLNDDFDWIFQQFPTTIPFFQESSTITTTAPDVPKTSAIPPSQKIPIEQQLTEPTVQSETSQPTPHSASSDPTNLAQSGNNNPSLQSTSNPIRLEPISSTDADVKVDNIQAPARTHRWERKKHSEEDNESEANIAAGDYKAWLGDFNRPMWNPLW